MTATPLGEGACLVIQSDGESLSVHLFQDGEDGPDIAWQAPEADDELFRWLVRGAAAFHKIHVEDDTDDTELPLEAYAVEEVHDA